MESETMEYCINQNVVFDAKEALRSRTADPKQGTQWTGKITGASGEDFIVTLDDRLRDGTKTVLVPSGSLRPLACHWCRDTQKVVATPVTLGQYESGDIPQKECPYCK